MPRKRLTRRQALAGIGGGLAVAAPLHAPEAAGQAVPPGPPEGAVPVTGKAGPGLEAFDAGMLQIMDRHGVPGAALAIAKDGKLRLAKGYGWADLSAGTPAAPDTLFALASLSKPITAVATLKLVEQGWLRLDDRAFDILDDLKPPRGARVDPRLRTVTLRQCLNHSGGWNRSVKGDPVNWTPWICRTLNLRPPLLPHHLLSFLLGVPLDFAPGTDVQYSNVGYIILGEVIAAVTRQSYVRYVGDTVLRPMGMKRVGMHDTSGKYLPGESHRHLAGTLQALPPLQLPMVDAAGGWSGTVVDMVRFLTALDGSRNGQPFLGEKAMKWMLEAPPPPIRPRDNGTHVGLGWDSVTVTDQGHGYFKDGSYQGMRTYMKRLPNGLNWALLFNASMEFDAQDMQAVQETLRQVRQMVESFGKYPDIDLFKDYP